MIKQRIFKRRKNLLLCFFLLMFGTGNISLYQTLKPTSKHQSQNEEFEIITDTVQRSGYPARHGI